MSARALPASLPLRLCAVHAAEHCASLESSPSRRSSRRCSVRARRRNGRGSPVDSADAPDAAVSAAGDSAAAPIGRCFAHSLALPYGSEFAWPESLFVCRRSSAAVGGSFGGTGAMVVDGRPPSAGAHVFGDAFSRLNFLSLRSP